MRVYTTKLNRLYKNHAHPLKAGPMKKYMKNKFEYFGLPMPERRAISREFIKKEGLPPADELPAVIRELWKQPQRELHYFAMDLAEKMKKVWTEEYITLFEEMIVQHSWWDTVDFIADKLAGSYFKLFPAGKKKITGRWINSDNMWLQRAAILFQLKYKKETDEQLLFSYVRKCAGSNEFFLRKGIGWALREYSKTNPGAVKKFIKETPLKPLSVREGMRLIKDGRLED